MPATGSECSNIATDYDAEAQEGMQPLECTTGEFLQIRNHRIPVGKIGVNPPTGRIGLRKDSLANKRVKSVVWPVVKTRDWLFVDGVIEWVIGRWIRELSDSKMTFLDIGCGDMRLQRFVPHEVWYNAFDLSLSEFHIERVLKRRSLVNLALASVTDIPLEDDKASLLVSTQVLEYVSRIDLAIDEIHRVATPEARLLVSIANGHCRKYRSKGPHRAHVNFWSQQEFLQLMESHDFRLLEADMRGYWIPLPRRLAKTSYELPIRSPEEYLNSYLFFVFQPIK